MSKGRELNAIWGRELNMIFCDLCIREVELGNRPSTHFNKEGWANLMKGFKELTGKEYDKSKLKNKWDQLKKDWKLWKELKRGSTGLGWDSTRNTVAASDEWWNEKLVVHPTAKKFRTAGIDPELESKLDRMFSGVVALGEHTWTPSTVLPTASEEVEGERLSNDEVADYLNNSTVGDDTPRPTPTTSQRPSARKRKKATNEIIADAVTNLVTSYSSAAAARAKRNSKTESLATALHQLETIPEIFNNHLL